MVKVCPTAVFALPRGLTCVATSIELRSKTIEFAEQNNLNCAAK